MKKMEKIRSFIAVEISNNEILDKIGKYQQKLQLVLGPLKLVKRDLIHLTLKFLGDISIETAEKLYSFIELEINGKIFYQNDVKHSGLLKGVGDFNKRVFFIKILGLNDLLQGISSQIENKLLKFPEIKKDLKPFKPHITIARAKRYKKNYQKPDINRSINQGQITYAKLKAIYKEFEFGEWIIKKVYLKKSVLTPSGPIYSNLKI